MFLWLWNFHKRKSNSWWISIAVYLIYIYIKLVFWVLFAVCLYTHTVYTCHMATVGLMTPLHRTMWQMFYNKQYIFAMPEIKDSVYLLFLIENKTKNNKLTRVWIQWASVRWIEYIYTIKYFVLMIGYLITHWLINE